MAEAAAGAAREQTGVDVRLQRADATSADDVLAADAYLFATPENLAAMSGLMKDFFDRCYYAALDRVNGRPYAVMICAEATGKRAAPDRPDRDRVAFEERGAGPDRLYARADAGTHPRGEDDRRRRSRALRRIGRRSCSGLSLGVFDRQRCDCDGRSTHVCMRRAPPRAAPIVRCTVLAECPALSCPLSPRKAGDIRAKDVSRDRAMRHRHGNCRS